MPLPSSRLLERRRARPLLGTRVEIALPPQDIAEDRMDRAIDAAFASIESVHRLMSFHDPLSDVSRLNRQASDRPVRVDPQTYRVLQSALAFSAASQGLFDISIAPVLEQDGLLPLLAGVVDHTASWRDIDLLGDRQVRFARPLHLDLGGIAKGYAVDCAVAQLQAMGVVTALVNAGGDLRVFGPRHYPVSLQHPARQGLIAHRFEIVNAALASSATTDSRRQQAGRWTSALVHPQDRRGYDGTCGVSVRAPDCMTADALTKIVLFAAPSAAEAVLARYGAAAIRLDPAVSSDTVTESTAC